MWTPDTRAEPDWDDLRYPSDLTDAEWQVFAPLFPSPAKTGCRRAWPMRELINAMFFVLKRSRTSRLDYSVFDRLTPMPTSTITLTASVGVMVIFKQVLPTPTGPNHARRHYASTFGSRGQHFNPSLGQGGCCFPRTDLGIAPNRPVHMTWMVRSRTCQLPS